MRYSRFVEIAGYEVDPNDRIKPSALIRHLQETANRHMIDRGPSYNQLVESGKTLILSRIGVELYDEIHQYDKLNIETWRSEIKGAGFHRWFEIKRDGISIGKCLTQWALVEIASKKILRPDEELFKNFEKDDELALVIPKRFKIPREKNLESCGKHQVIYSELDINVHLNNTFYPDILWSRIENVSKYGISSINIRFAREGRLGEVIDIEKCVLDEFEKFDPNADELTAFKTYIDGELNTESVIGLRNFK